MVIIGKKKIADGNPCFITFEAGPTHDGIDSALELVEVASNSGADAIKFQIMDPDRLVADRKQPFTYQILMDKLSGETQEKTEPLYEILKRRCLTREQWMHVSNRCRELSLSFFATAFFDDEIEFLQELQCDSIKIASGDINHFSLIRKAANTGLIIQIDTGNATIGEIEAAVDVIVKTGNENIIIHQCPSGYPAHLESINLNIIKTLKHMFPYPIAFSDHSPGWDMDIAAVALGANLIEKTITKDRCIPSVEHMMSLEPDACESFVKAIRDLEIALGSTRRTMSFAELKSREKIRRSVVLTEASQSGSPLAQLSIEYSRPGDGLRPEEFECYKHLTINKDLPAQTKLTLADIKF